MRNFLFSIVSIAGILWRLTKKLLFWLLAIIGILLVIFISITYWHNHTPNIQIAQNAPLKIKIQAVDKWFDQLEKKERFNGTVLYAKKGEVLYQRNVGFADAKSSVSISNRSSFNLASVSKQMTALGIMLLAYDKKLDFDDRIANYLPELSGYEGITIRHLLHHTSGIPDYEPLAAKLLPKGKIMDAKTMISWLQPEKAPPLFQPGEKYQYSNTGYVLLAEIIERVSGIPFPEFMKTRVFTPLDMGDTEVFTKLSQESKLKERVFGFEKEFVYFGKNIANDLNQFDGIAGDGNIYASALDLLKWDVALTKGTLLPTEFYNQAYESGILNSGKKTGYGFGWHVEEKPVVYHRGGWVGFFASIYRDMEQETLLVVLSNSGVVLRPVFITNKVLKVFEDNTIDVF
ncbi:MAG: serine hydrolase domain-containing protein [Nostocaceae cyanobacterium]|nr:serine hydrolase domain-containing protein [Nostocaceae cyanobacterium]